MFNFMEDPNAQTLMARYISLLMQLVGVALAVLVDPYIKRENRIRIYIIVVIVTYLLFEPYVTETYGPALFGSHGVLWYTFHSSFSYIMRTVVLYLFIGLSGNTWGKNILRAILVINAFFCCSAFFVPWVFVFNENYGWHRGPLGFIPFVASFILVLWLVVGSVIRFRGIKRRESSIPVIISIFVVVAVLGDVEMGFSPMVSFLNVAMTGSTVFFYIWMHLQFVREHEKAIRAEQRIKIMMSQIQPHFLFNALSTIQALTETDPERASKVIEEFATYLRQNINSLNQDSMIPVSKEIEHTKTYSDIEEVRFPSIKIEYDIEDDEFLIPPLTIQPMVENAIRHGVRGKKHGWVCVNIYREGDMHVISIRDNGKGFDVNQMIEDTKNGDHIGIKNVRDRIKEMTGGTFSIESVIGEGTSITIRIPA